MEHRPYEGRPATGQAGEGQTIIYTCWPFWGGSIVCGVILVLIGGALILSDYFPTSPELVWGIVLIVAGAFSVAWSARRGEWR